LADMGAQMMVAVLSDLEGHPEAAQGDDGVTYASKIDKDEARLDFTQSAEQVERKVRAFAPTPGAFFELEGDRYRVLQAEVVSAEGSPGTTLDEQLTIACGSGAIRPTLIQRAGRPAMATAALLRGRAILLGTQLRS
jgi:methionyl-tRNA formyltransferase